MMQVLADLVGPYGRNIRAAFYLIVPWEMKYSSNFAAPPFVDEVIPWLLILIVLEICYCWKKGLKNVYQLEDSLVSLTAGYFHLMVDKVAFRTVQMSLYAWIFENWSIYRLPLDSAWTWLITFIAVDFFYYWFHRAAHEVSIFWAVHSIHHSSEYYNYTVALRHSIFQQYVVILFYLPEALFIPPPMHLVHEILSLVFQFWIHTELLGSLGPLGWIINTPSYHRVHHGRNRYCIDKNYSGTLIIWDRLFGTFQEELDNEPIAYGWTHNLNSFDTIDVQFHHFRHIFLEKLPAMDGLMNKAKAVFYGPGWVPGKSRTGDLMDIPEVTYPIQRYHCGVAPWVSGYILVHGASCLITYQSIAKRLRLLPQLISIEFASAMTFSAIILGALLEKKRWAPLAELLRCLLFCFWLYPLTWPSGHPMRSIMQAVIALSALLWIAIITSRGGHKLIAKRL